MGNLQNQTTQMPAPPKSPGGKVGSILIAVVITAIVVGGGMYFTINNDDVTSNEIRLSDATWSKQSVDEYGFSFEYPITHLIAARSSYNNYGSLYRQEFHSAKTVKFPVEQLAGEKEVIGQQISPAYEIIVEVLNNKYDSDDEFFERQIEILSNPDTDNGPYKIITVAGKKWLETKPGHGLGGGRILTLPFKDYLYRFEYYEFGNNEYGGEIFQKILESASIKTK